MTRLLAGIALAGSFACSGGVEVLRGSSHDGAADRAGTLSPVDARASTCTASGGTVVTRPCCKASSGFPNTCNIGACGCSPENSAPVPACECPADTCFDGTRCVPSQRAGERAGVVGEVW